MIRIVALIIYAALKAMIPMLGFWFILEYWNEKHPMSDYSREETEKEVCRRAAICVWLVSAILIAYMLGILK